MSGQKLRKVRAGSTAERLLTLVALSGELPTNQVSQKTKMQKKQKNFIK